MRQGYTESVGGKLKPKDKKLLDDSPYNVRHAVEFLNRHISDPVEILKVEKYFLEEELREKKLDVIVLEKQIEDKNKELGIHEYSEELNSFLEYVKSDYIKVGREFALDKYADGEFEKLSIESYIDGRLEFMIDKADTIGIDVKQLYKEVIAYVQS